VDSLTILALSIKPISALRNHIFKTKGTSINKVLTLFSNMINLSLAQNKAIEANKGAWEGSTKKCLRLEVGTTYIKGQFLTLQLRMYVGLLHLNIYESMSLVKAVSKELF